MSTTPTTEPEIVVIKEKKDDGSAWLWAIFAVVFVAMILLIVGVCLSNKKHKQVVYMQPSATSVPPSVASSASSLAGGRSRHYRQNMSVAPVSHSVLNSSTAPMSFLSY